MKIAILNKYQNKVKRGSETFIREISKRLSTNHEVDVIDNVNYFKIYKNKYNLIIPTNGRIQAILIRIIAWLSGAKVLISGHSGIGFDDRINLYTFPNVFVAFTDFQKSWAKKINPFVKVVKIPNGVDLNKFNDKKTNAKNINQKIVLAVGAFAENKRHDLTIKAVSKLKDTKLVIAGSGGNKIQDIKLLGEKLLGNEKFETVETTNDKMPEIYRKADLFVFPTVSWESFGIALLEAMASGLPIVASDDPIRREIVGDAGLFVDPTDTESYAKAIEKALNTKWGGKPRNQAEKFNWDKIVLEYEKLIEEL